LTLYGIFREKKGVRKRCNAFSRVFKRKSSDEISTKNCSCIYLKESIKFRGKNMSSKREDSNKIEPEQLLFDNRINSLPVIMTFKQVAELFQVSIFTIYQWSSKGRFDKCKFKAGKIVRVHRDKLFQEFFSGSFLRKDSK
jgi:hypothetical protein